MNGTQHRKQIRNAVFMLAFSIILSGCFLTETADVVDPDIEAANVLSGSVGDGPIVGASIRVLRNDGVILAEFESDANAGYNVTVRTNSEYYPLFLDARNGIDLVTNLTPDFDMYGVVFAPSNNSTANLNPFSTLALEIARDMSGGLTSANIRTGEQIAVNRMNSGLTSLVNTGPMATLIDSNNIAEIVKASETLGEIVRRSRDHLLAFGFSYDGNQLMQALGSDLIDNVLDGRGGPRSDARVAAVVTIVAAQVTLESLANELRVNGVDANAAMNSAIVQMLGDSPQISLEQQVATADMLITSQTGLAAADALSTDPRVSQLRTTVSLLQTAMESSTISALLPADYQQILENVLLLFAGGDATTVAIVNDIARNGGTDPVPNRVPTISGTPDLAIEAGTAYSFVPTASDADADSLTFSISGRPTWAVFSPANGALAGTPAIGDVGSYPNIIVSVSDGQASVALPPFSIAVTSTIVNSAPTITGTPISSVEVGSAYSFVPAGNDADGDALTFSISGQPAWAGFDPIDGALTGSPASTDVGNYPSIVISVSDGQASASLAPFFIDVTSAAMNSVPTILGNPVSSIDVGSAYSFVPVASDADGDALTFDISGKPSWASFDPADGSLTGIPISTDIGTHGNIVISVSDGQDSASLAAFSIEVLSVAANNPPTLSGVPSTEVMVDSAYSFVPTATDADGDALTFSVVGLPAWAVFESASGRISGSPGPGDVGTYAGIVITVSDSVDSTSLAAFSITVQAISLGSVTLSWTPPTENEDGTALTDLAGYRFYWGTSPGNYPNSVTINNPGISTYVVDNLAPGTYEFVATALNAAGVESAYSNPATKLVQ